MLPNGEATALQSDTRVLFVIDKSVSMRALDYNGNEERLKGVINDCCYIVDELASCKFSIITFGDEVRRISPYTIDTDSIISEIKALRLENEDYSPGSSMNSAKNYLEKILKNEEKNSNKTVIFFISDGEITRKNEKLESFEGLAKYFTNGAVLGYGTSAGGKMVTTSQINYPEEANGENYYVTYYENYEIKQAISKIDENNLKKIASDLKVDYIQMSKTSNINYKIANIKKQISESKSKEEKIRSYKDIYYYFAIPLVILLIIDLIIKKRRIK